MAIAGVPPTIQPRTPQGVFANEPFTDFNDPENARAMRQRSRQVAVHLGSDYPLIIGGKRLRTTEQIRSINPARPAQIVGIHQKAGAAQVDAAMSAALRAFDSWSQTRSMSVHPCCSTPPTSFASASLSSWRGSPTKSARTGPKPMPTWAKPSTSLSSTPAKRCAWPPPPRPFSIPASATSYFTFRSEWAPSFRPGTFPSPSWPA